MIFPSLAGTPQFFTGNPLFLTLLYVDNVGLAPSRNTGLASGLDLGLSASTPEIKRDVNGDHHLEPENDANTEEEIPDGIM